MQDITLFKEVLLLFQFSSVQLANWSGEEVNCFQSTLGYIELVLTSRLNEEDFFLYEQIHQN